jgi:hypothetical protein
MKFKDGDEVAHIDNVEKKLRVTTINKHEEFFKTGNLDKNGSEEIKPRSRMDGITCHWWKDNEVQTYTFHSRELVPWDIALKGKEEAEEWLSTKQYMNS